MQVDLRNSSNIDIIRGEYLWPNELALFSDKYNNSILLIPDGFLLPGQSDGGLFIIREPHVPFVSPIRITAEKNGWFYHRATHIKLPNGIEGILTARAKKSLFGRGNGELVWLPIPNYILEGKPIQDEIWSEVVLAEGPDVMFEVIDIDRQDPYIEVIAAHFFESKVSVLKLQAIDVKPYVQVAGQIFLDTIGRPYGLCMATMSPPESPSPSPYCNTPPVRSMLNLHDIKQPSTSQSVPSASTSTSSRSTSSMNRKSKYRERLPTSRCDTSSPTHVLVSTHECSYDFFSAVKMALSAIGGRYPRVRTGGTGLRSGDRTDVESGMRAAEFDRGGGLYAYEIPRHPLPDAHSNAFQSKNHLWIML